MAKTVVASMIDRTIQEVILREVTLLELAGRLGGELRAYDGSTSRTDPPLRPGPGWYPVTGLAP